MGILSHAMNHTGHRIGGVGVLGGGGVGLFVAVDDETERFSSKHVSDRSLNRFINRLT